MTNIIFDIDGVLIDVRRSFHDTIKLAVTYYLKDCLGIPIKRQAISEEDIRAFKFSGGFNDDWDLTAGVIYYFVSLLPKTNSTIKKDSLLAIKDSLSIQVPKSNNILHKKDIPNFLRKVKGRGLEGVLKATGGKNKELVFFGGDINKDNLVKRIFQEIYWGVDMFPKMHNGEKNIFYFKPGKIHKELLIAHPDVLRRLSSKEKVTLSIITGREAKDAEYSLEKYNLKQYFDHIFTLSDIKDKTKKKPDPHSLFVLEKQIGKTFDKRYYVGDQVDDILMANSAKKQFDITSIGFVYHAKDYEHKQQLREHKADKIIDNWRSLEGAFDV